MNEDSEYIDNECPECSGTGSELSLEDGRYYVEGDCLECGGTGDKNEAREE
jgi:DnaJ-class molecular chaperone